MTTQSPALRLLSLNAKVASNQTTLYFLTNPISLLTSQHIHRCRFPASNNQKPCHPSLNTYHPLHLRITRSTLNQRHEANFVVFTVCEKTTSPSKHSRESCRLRGRVHRRPFLTGWPTCEELSCGSNTLQDICTPARMCGAKTHAHTRRTFSWSLSSP